MSTLIIPRDGVDQTASLLTGAPDSSTLVYLDEHSDSSPSTIELRRKLPVSETGVRRTYVNRRLGVTLFPDTDQEERAVIVAKLELSIPVGAETADIDKVVDDIVGTVGTTTYANLNAYGVVAI